MSEYSENDLVDTDYGLMIVICGDERDGYGVNPVKVSGWMAGAPVISGDDSNREGLDRLSWAVTPWSLSSTIKYPVMPPEAIKGHHKFEPPADQQN